VIDLQLWGKGIPDLGLVDAHRMDSQLLPVGRGVRAAPAPVAHLHREPMGREGLGEASEVTVVVEGGAEGPGELGEERSETSGLDSLQSFGELEAESRLDNIRTLQSYIEITMQEEVTPIEFMDRAALLQSGEENDDDTDAPKINLMSLHRAKGLEFDTVVLAGVEEGLLPHQRSLDEGNTDEERRLLYVGVTRAENALLITSARQRRVFGDMHFPMPSQFIKDLDADVLHRDKPLAKPSRLSISHDSGLDIGSSVSHPSFGEGVVLELEGNGDATRVSVEFERVGLKRLMLKYAALQIL